jgi:hypothetical protein
MLRWKIDRKQSNAAKAEMPASCRPRLFCECSNDRSSDQILRASRQRSLGGRDFDDGRFSRIHCRWHFVFSSAVSPSHFVLREVGVIESIDFSEGAQRAARDLLDLGSRFGLDDSGFGRIGR